MVHNFLTGPRNPPLIVNDYHRLMEDKRAKTYAGLCTPSQITSNSRTNSLQALSTFIDKQRALLTRTHADTTRLNELRSRAVEHPEEFERNLSKEVRVHLVFEFFFLMFMMPHTAE